MIIEGLCTTVDSLGDVNLAPMGPIVDEQLTSFLFRPFSTSTTFANLKSEACGVFHVTDDVELIARAALGSVRDVDTLPAEVVQGRVLRDCCRWYEFEVTSIDESSDRTEMTTRIVHQGRCRDFFGFNRAKHAVLELTILATRLHMVPKEEILKEADRLRVAVEKTAGESEFRAFQFVENYIQQFHEE